MTTQTQEQVLIAGASFAGLATALWMRRLGYDASIVEVAPGLKRGGTPVDIRDDTIAIVDRMGLLEQISAKALAPRVTEFTTPEGDSIARMDPVPPSAGSTGDGYEIHRDDLLDILAAATEGEVEMLWNNSVTSLHETDEERVHVTFRDGTERDFSMVFGCDGNHSTVRRLHFGQEALYSHFLQTYFSVATLDDLVIEPQTTRITNAPGVTMLVNSYDTTTDLVLGFRSEKEIPFDHRDEAAQKRILRDHMLRAGSPFSDHVDEAIGVETFYFDKLSQIKMPAWTSGRVALVGDAGYCPSPAAGMGGSLAIIGATALHDALRDAGDDVEQAFAGYERALRPVVEAVQHDAKHIGVSSYFPATADQIDARNRMLLDR
ncbi:FAD-dependent monooxygenase [Curtobacterium flaccumfaciens]|uniref:FAD-dependent monooxygenase n=1 Tax=Curtobacterium flaccumfaciens TaxID=2035 RepID=UPI00159B6843|nr:FAD-dependent monooxygenase [Curtobacterium flaccumfaciens]QKS88371.1 FAD-binding monooxygenase [Curtobacterium flaccumfaciens pv. flaccumfaciens]